MDEDLTVMDKDEIKNLKKELLLKISDLKSDATPKVPKIKMLREDVAELNAELKRRMSDVKPVEKVDGQTKIEKDIFSAALKRINNNLATEVPIFSSGQDVHGFLKKLDGYYALDVKSDTTGQMDGQFVKAAKSRLCSEYLNAIGASDVDTSTYDGFKNI